MKGKGKHTKINQENIMLKITLYNHKSQGTVIGRCKDEKEIIELLNKYDYGATAVVECECCYNYCGTYDFIDEIYWKKRR